ncbi:OadG family protein [Sporomusa sp. KB1]|uniref:OadG family protein n=1 Tax=Sporomusa sp. KB1 TaxID=943346 RepID=UPI0011A477B7|nr:OadG family protein [Sporomusa sp. KB1]TWH48196.1 oxaloacetate decarboxylase gamma subunit [Sporomusa sp. KB1]
MGFLDSLLGKSEPPKAKKKKQSPDAAVTEIAATVSMAVAAENISPEIVAVITASIYAMMGTGNLAVRITRTSNQWGNVGRQKIMDSRQFV